MILEKHYICLLQVCVVHIDKKYIGEQSHIKLMLGGLDDISPMKPQHLFSKKKKKKIDTKFDIDTKFVDATSFSDHLIFKEYVVLKRLW